jgi:hypothetical protein
MRVIVGYCTLRNTDRYRGCNNLSIPQQSRFLGSTKGLAIRLYPDV